MLQRKPGYTVMEGVTMKEKWIFLDIDGTLTRPGSNVPPESALKAIRAAQAKGHKVLLCTGRNMALLSPLLQYGFDGVVASAGGYILYGGQVIYDCPMSRQQLELALETFHAGGVFCTIEAKDATYGDEALEDFLSQSPGENSEIQRWRAALADRLGILPMEDYDGRPIYKVVFICREDSQLEKARAALEKEFLFCCQTMSSPSRINGELINRKFDKGQGIRRLCRHLGVDLQDTFGFGDSMNDLEMMQTVGVAVAMANGNEQIKALADYICPPVEEDGLAKAFARYQLA